MSAKICYDAVGDAVDWNTTAAKNIKKTTGKSTSTFAKEMGQHRSMCSSHAESYLESNITPITQVDERGLLPQLERFHCTRAARIQKK